MNLIAKIKRLEAEAAERDKRIAALEALAGAPPRKPPPPVIVSASAEGDEHIRLVKAAVNATFPKVITVEPRKKRNVRAKTYGTE